VESDSCHQSRVAWLEKRKGRTAVDSSCLITQRVAEHRGDDEIQPQLRVVAVEKPEGKGNAEASDDGERHESVGLARTVHVLSGGKSVGDVS
jgi:hypothetical protein